MYIHYTYLLDADIKRSQFLLLNPVRMVGYVPIFKKTHFCWSVVESFICFKYMKLNVIVKIHQMIKLKKKKHRPICLIQGQLKNNLCLSPSLNQWHLIEYNGLKDLFCKEIKLFSEVPTAVSNARANHTSFFMQ